MSNPIVTINGVRYLPAETVIGNERSIMEGLLLQWWGDCKGKSLDEVRSLCEQVRVIVSDGEPEGSGVSVAELIADIAEIAQATEEPNNEGEQDGA